MRHVLLAAALAVTGFATVSQAAFIVEPHSSGKANANFTGNTTSTSIAGHAIGLTATNSVFGGTGTDATTDPDKYVFSYTPGTDADNTVIAGGTDLGNGDLATGLVGGISGKYNVYITWVPTTGVNTSGCSITVTNDGADVVLNPVGMNTGDTGSPGATDAWYKIASDVELTAGTTYTITQQANSTAFVSQRNAGVMWEYVGPVPEPASLSLLAFGALPLLRRRRA